MKPVDKTHWLSVLEAMSLGATVGGSVAARLFSESLLFSTPLSITLCLSLLNRRRLNDLIQHANDQDLDHLQQEVDHLNQFIAASLRSPQRLALPAAPPERMPPEHIDVVLASTETASALPSEAQEIDGEPLESQSVSGDPSNQNLFDRPSTFPAPSQDLTFLASESSGIPVSLGAEPPSDLIQAQELTSQDPDDQESDGQGVIITPAFNPIADQATAISPDPISDTMADLAISPETTATDRPQEPPQEIGLDTSPQAPPPKQVQPLSQSNDLRTVAQDLLPSITLLHTQIDQLNQQLSQLFQGQEVSALAQIVATLEARMRQVQQPEQPEPQPPQQPDAVDPIRDGAGASDTRQATEPHPATELIEPLPQEDLVALTNPDQPLDKPEEQRLPIVLPQSSQAQAYQDTTLHGIAPHEALHPPGSSLNRSTGSPAEHTGIDHDFEALADAIVQLEHPNQERAPSTNISPSLHLQCILAANHDSADD